MSASEFPYGASLNSLNGLVQPVDGKNVLAAYNDNYYACHGKGGLNVTNLVTNFREYCKEPVNGIAIDDDFIYLASGSYLRVLDHSLNQVTEYHLPAVSANYIQLAEYNGDKYILMAFGQNGIKVFRLNK